MTAPHQTPDFDVDADDVKRMAPVYIAVIVVEVVVLFGLWTFQTIFG